MDNPTSTKLSKFLSFVLRHRPDSIDVELDSAGWVGIASLIEKCNAHGTAITPEVLNDIVKSDPKGRYGISDDGLRIRANQGHSVKVKIDYKKATPPARLFHGTIQSSLAGIMKKGIDKMKRHHVHLSADEKTAVAVGSRRGHAIVLEVDAAKMAKDGHTFLISENGVWLTESVPAKYIRA